MVAKTAHSTLGNVAVGGKLDSDWHALVTALVLELDRRERDRTRRFLVFLPTFAWKAVKAVL